MRLTTYVRSSREDVVRTTDLFGNMGFKVDLKDLTKTSREGHRYFLEGVPGVAGDPRVDPVLAVALYLLMRGDEDVYLFCRFATTSSGAFEIRAEVRSNAKGFLEELRSSLDEAGVETYRFLGTHSFKRGGVQLYKQLGGPDVEIMKRGHWATNSAFYSYLQSCNRLERRLTYSSPLAALADVIASGGVVSEEATRLIAM